MTELLQFQLYLNFLIYVEAETAHHKVCKGMTSGEMKGHTHHRDILFCLNSKRVHANVWRGTVS